jgi:hypothetical protein
MAIQLRYIAFHPVRGVFLGYTHPEQRPVWSKDKDAAGRYAPTFADRVDLEEYASGKPFTSELVGCELRQVFPRVGTEASAAECANALVPSTPW